MGVHFISIKAALAVSAQGSKIWKTLDVKYG